MPFYCPILFTIPHFVTRAHLLPPQLLPRCVPAAPATFVPLPSTVLFCRLPSLTTMYIRAGSVLVLHMPFLSVRSYSAYIFTTTALYDFIPRF